MKLRQIRSPKDLKRLSIQQLTTLAAEIRRFLINNLSVTGGHLASNLGVVELTLALHAVFESPRDKIVWDVGHQSYVHKILTGRRDRFRTLRQLDGLSGFPKINESEHDVFGTGHSSTSISAALGLCAARDLRSDTPQDEKIVAIIGDGSMTGGLAYEALNNAGRSNTDILVVVNDNQMSIAENVGAVSRHLNDIRTTQLYLDAKQDVHRLLERVPVVGNRAAKLIEQAKDAVKFLLVPGVMFEELGFQYFGPVDGHDLRALTEVLQKIKHIRGPVMLHVLTIKGKGYNQAEHAPVDFHGVGSFRVETGEPTVQKNGDTYTDIFGKSITKLAARDDRIVAVSAAMTDGTGLTAFKKRFPRRFHDVGIAEGHAVTFAAGLARGGLRPVVAVYSSFLQRAYDQILHDVCLQNLPVVFAVDHAGVVGPDGETHQGLFDISYLSHMPNLVMMAPKNAAELSDMLSFAFSYDGPVAIRYPKGTASHIQEAQGTPPLRYGAAETVLRGDTVALVPVGAMMDVAAEAVGLLRGAGLSPGLYNARFIKPLDMELVTRLAGYAYVFTLEDNVRNGGYGLRLMDALLPSVRHGLYFHPFAFPDQYMEQGTRAELFKRYKMDAASIAAHILHVMRINPPMTRTSPPLTRTSPPLMQNNPHTGGEPTA